MKASEIKVGERYYAKVSGKSVIVRVDKLIHPVSYWVTNTVTGREMVWHDTGRFIAPVIKHDDPHESPIGQAMTDLGATPITLPNPSDPIATRAQRQKSNGNASHLIVLARAGTGKTTTLVEGLKWVMGVSEQCKLKPSSQQSAIWHEMMPDFVKGGSAPSSICFVAFNKAIATELQERVPTGCDAMTMHSLGFRAVRDRFGSVKVNSYRVQDVISEEMLTDIRELRRKKPDVLRATERLVGLCKVNLVCDTRWDLHTSDWWPGQLSSLTSHYDVDLNGCQAEVFDLVPKVLERCKDVDQDKCLDFNDMIWLPVVLGLSVFKYDLLLVDEAQDLNRCQQELALMAGDRLILCGDDKQAIYGFAGADSESLNRMHKRLHATDRGCVVLPLTVTRRCGRAIVAEAQKYVPDFQAHESCGDGKFVTAPWDQRAYHTQVQDGDMILCRCNAPLVSECFRFLREGRKAVIRGRDMGQGLITLVKKMKADDLPSLSNRLSEWLHHETQVENAKRNPNEAKLINLQDKCDCLMAFIEDAWGETIVESVIRRIEAIFTDDKNGQGIMLSSIHKAKGLEADRVFLLQPANAPIPHPMAKSKSAQEQEYNLLYVAITRAKNELVYVS